MYKMMTPGPSQVRENVLQARSRQFQNPDLDSDFVEYYHDTCILYSSLLHTENESLILGGEGILGLEAACASLTEPGDRFWFWITVSSVKVLRISSPCMAVLRFSTPETTPDHLTWMI